MRNLALPADTTVEAARVQMGVLRRLGIDHAARMAVELSENVRSIALAGIRAGHPEFTEEQVRLMEIRSRLGEDLFYKAYRARTEQ